MASNLGPEELRKLAELEQWITNFRSDLGQPPETLGEKMADRVSGIVGSWKFLLGQGALLIVYMVGQVKVLSADAFDPYPFVLLNLMLSFQAAFTAPIILMAQNRADAKDRRHARKAYRTIGHMEELLSAIAEMDGIDPDQPSGESGEPTGPPEPPPLEPGKPSSTDSQSS